MPIANADRAAMLTISAAGLTATGWVVETLVGWLARDASRTVGLTPFSAPVAQAERKARPAMSADGFIEPQAPTASRRGFSNSCPESIAASCARAPDCWHRANPH